MEIAQVWAGGSHQMCPWMKESSGQPADKRSIYGCSKGKSQWQIVEISVEAAKVRAGIQQRYLWTQKRSWKAVNIRGIQSGGGIHSPSSGWIDHRTVRYAEKVRTGGRQRYAWMQKRSGQVADRRDINVEKVSNRNQLNRCTQSCYHKHRRHRLMRFKKGSSFTGVCAETHSRKVQGDSK